MRQAIIIVGLGFGDEGKGSVCDFYTREHSAHTVVRFSGGANAGHRVVTPAGRHHIFAQFGSGTFAGARTYISKHALFDPAALMQEMLHLKKMGVEDPLGMISIDENAVVVTQYHKAANRLREMSRGENRHGTTGMGIGETAADAMAGVRIYAKDLLDPIVLEEKLIEIQSRKFREAYEGAWTSPGMDEHLLDMFSEPPAKYAKKLCRAAILMKIVPATYLVEDVLSKHGTVIFEGSQGILLDQKFGFFPWVTRSNLLPDPVFDLMGDQYNGEIHTVGVTRAYATRHGPGPMPTYSQSMSEQMLDSHNVMSPYQREFRVGWLDLNLLEYSINACMGICQLDMTCLDRLNHLDVIKVCTGYKNMNLATPDKPTQEGQIALAKRLLTAQPEYQEVSPSELPQMVADWMKTPLGTCSYGVSADDKMTFSSSVVDKDHADVHVSSKSRKFGSLSL